MKRMMVVATAACAAMIALWAAGARAEGEDRYQLFQGQYKAWDEGSGSMVDSSDLFLLDSTTGDIQIYSVSTNKDGKTVRAWTPAVYDETKSVFG